MSAVHLDGARRRAGGRTPAGSRGVLIFPIVLLGGLVACAVVFIVYVLWPRWPEPPVEGGMPSLPITVAGVAFNVPPAAIRVPVQRRPAAQDRVDLAFLWPSLAPPDSSSKPKAADGAPPADVLQRLFVTIAVADDALAPADRVKAIYPRYVAAAAAPGPSGLAVLAFRDDSPYRGEDLIYDAGAPENFLVRCTRSGPGPTPGICLQERRIEAADIIARFPRDWLTDWRAVAIKIDLLLASIQPRSAPH
jgi:hypothetical protein